jgi:hypothetical protein
MRRREDAEVNRVYALVNRTNAGLEGEGEELKCSISLMIVSSVPKLEMNYTFFSIIALAMPAVEQSIRELEDTRTGLEEMSWVEFVEIWCLLGPATKEGIMPDAPNSSEDCTACRTQCKNQGKTRGNKRDEGPQVSSPKD